MLKAYKYRLYPTKVQMVLLEKHFGCTRYVYNYGLERKIKAYSESKKSISRLTLSADLPKLKNAPETKWLSEVSAQSLQAALVNLDKAFTRFFKEKRVSPNLNQSDQVINRIKSPKMSQLTIMHVLYIYQNSITVLNANSIGNLKEK